MSRSRNHRGQWRGRTAYKQWVKWITNYKTRAVFRRTDLTQDEVVVRRSTVEVIRDAA